MKTSVNANEKEFHKKPQFHLHRIGKGATKCCYGTLTEKYTEMTTGSFDFSVDILSKAKLLNVATTAWFYPRLKLIPYYMN